MMKRYAQINPITGKVVGDSYLSGEVFHDNLIPISDDFDLANKRYINGEWIACEPEPESDPEPTEQEIINAEILLNQAEILSNQNAVDEVLAEILLNQIGG